MQLIEPGVDMLDTMKNARCGSEIVMEKFGVAPEKLGDVLALMGDTVDNVPGVPGIGPNTAAKLINEFAELESVPAAAPLMKKSKVPENPLAPSEMARPGSKQVALTTGKSAAER